MPKSVHVVIAMMVTLGFPASTHAQVNCPIITVPEGAPGVTVRGHSVQGPRCFDFTPGVGRAGTISLTEGNGTLLIEAVTAGVKSFDFEAGPWTYYIYVNAEPFGSAGGPFALQVNWR